MVKNTNTKKTKMGADVGSGAAFSVRSVQKVHNNFICDIWDTLESLSDVEDTLFVLGIAEETDNITIRLNCDGGSTYVGEAILLAMQNCQADIHVEASGRICSFATFILLNCDSFEISPFCEVLCHSAAYGAMGKMEETKQRIDFAYKQCEKMLRYYYEGFLTTEEVDRLIYQGYEHWMTSEEFCERFKKMVEYRQAKIEAIQQGDEDDDDEESDSPCSRTTCTCKSED